MNSILAVYFFLYSQYCLSIYTNTNTHIHHISSTNVHVKSDYILRYDKLSFLPIIIIIIIILLSR